MDNQTKTAKAQAIKSLEFDIGVTKDQIKTRKELITEHIESTPSWLEFQTAKEELTRKKAALDQALAGDGEYNNMLEDLGQLNEKKKDQMKTLSDLVVWYFIETSEKQLETESNGDAREIVITGKLGKKGKYQTSLFVGKKL